jgi:hypothetical protein
VNDWRWRLRVKGGEGSGHHGHSGRPGKVGGSLPGNVSDAEFAAAARTDNIGEDWPLGGGITDSRLLEFRGDGKGVWKEDEGVNLAAAEVLTDELDDALGFNVVPRTVHLTNQFKQEGSCQRFISDASMAIDLEEEGRLLRAMEANRERVEGMIVLDYLTGNRDRHFGNVLFDRDGTLWAIDNGAAYNWGKRAGIQWAIDLEPDVFSTRRFKLSPGVMKMLEGAEPAKVKGIMGQARATGLGSGGWDLFEEILRTGELAW